MERLKKISDQRKGEVSYTYRRYLYEEIDWNQRLVVILGQRGMGKTTLLIQRMNQIGQNAIYLSLDDIYFEANRLVLLADILYDEGYRYLFLDEVHRYQHWSKDIKNIYDHYSGMKLIVTGSSILDIRKGQADLSRRSSIYHLSGLSFREFLHLETGLELDSILLDNLLGHHQDIASHITDLTAPLPLFSEFLKYGYYPFYKEGKETFGQKLVETVNLVLELDIGPWDQINHSTIRHMKKLLYIISQSVPFTPNISQLAEKIGISRNTLLKLLDSLHQAGLIALLRRSSKGMSYLQKPEKIYLQNPTVAYHLSGDHPNIGNLRETFFYSQLQAVHQVSAPRYGDFLVDDRYIFEVGGPSKTYQQISGLPNAYIAADQIKSGTGDKIPLWLFGLLY